MSFLSCLSQELFRISYMSSVNWNVISPIGGVTIICTQVKSIVWDRSNK